MHQLLQKNRVRSCTMCVTPKGSFTASDSVNCILKVLQGHEGNNAIIIRITHSQEWVLTRSQEWVLTHPHKVFHYGRFVHAAAKEVSMNKIAL